MDNKSVPQRLEQIPTLWDQIREAQTGTGPAAAMAVETLFQHYGGAVQRYLLVALGDAQAAADLTQEFALALVQGKFRQADPQLGRFRDYIKGVLFHLVSQYRRRQKKRPAKLPADVAAAGSHDGDQQFKQSWRDELLARAWAALVEVNPEYFTVLHFRAAHPDLSAEQMVKELQPQLGKPVSTDYARQILHRARKLFADLLLADVARSLKHPTLDAVQQELHDLDLHPYFQARK